MPIPRGSGVACGPKEYACSGGSKCGVLCNRTTECPLGDDEHSGCNLAQTNCQPNQFDCGGGACIPIAQRCDGMVQCQGNVDEASCVIKGQPDTLGCGTRMPAEQFCNAQNGQPACFKDICADGKICANDLATCAKPIECPASTPHRCPGDSRKAQQCTSDATLAMCGLTSTPNPCADPTQFQCSDGECYNYVCPANNTCSLIPC